MLIFILKLCEFSTSIKKPSNQQFQESSYQNRKTVQRIQFSIYRITTVGWSKSQLHLTSCLIYRSQISHYALRVKLPNLTERLVICLS